MTSVNDDIDVARINVGDASESVPVSRVALTKRNLSTSLSSISDVESCCRVIHSNCLFGPEVVGFPIAFIYRKPRCSASIDILAAGFVKMRMTSASASSIPLAAIRYCCSAAVNTE